MGADRPHAQNRLLPRRHEGVADRRLPLSVDWFTRAPNGALLLKLHVQPGARRTSIAGLHGGALKVRLAAPPVEGKANEALIEFLAGRFAVPKRNVAIVSGEHSREKRVEIVGANDEPEAVLRAEEP